jgi:hypothetical protein
MCSKKQKTPVVQNPCINKQNSKCSQFIVSVRVISSSLVIAILFQWYNYSSVYTKSITRIYKEGKTKGELNGNPSFYKKKKKKRRNKNSLVTPQWQQGPCLPISLSFFLESRKLKFKEIIYERERENIKTQFI